MKRKTVLGYAILSLAAIFLSTSCFTPSADAKMKKGEVSVKNDYSEISVNSAIEVTWSETATAISISADESVYDRVAVERSGQKLKIYIKKYSAETVNGSVKVVVPASANVNSIKLAGASAFISASTIKARKMDVELSGASRFKGDVTATGELEISCSGSSVFTGNIFSAELSVELSGASTAKLSGTTGPAEIEASGASSLTANGKALVTSNTECEVSGASHVRIASNGNIKGSVSGASSLRYGDNAMSVRVNCTGASTVKP